MDDAALDRIAAAVRSSGLVGERTNGLALCSTRGKRTNGTTA
jgi:hypothetical protein